MNWIVENTVVIALIRAILVTIAAVLSFVYPEYTKQLYILIFICLLTIPIVEILRKMVKQRNE
ncbi:hypothetical protein [Lysinibacillus fusiformis]|uniref:hypothetical protein n=1 Tax=Lysinibacillus fusiformis TaxID=28031 RepID=UPI0018815BD5|nr:hypothetical protein [Lysinibacillus fusiformis]MBD8523844.1 hypothetical protein [Lysinibacillus fusiformis]